MPSYTPTDAALAGVSLVTIVLDILAGYGVLPAIEPQQRVALTTDLTVLAAIGITLFAAHRGVKHVAGVMAQAKVAAAQAIASPAPASDVPVPPPAPPPPPFVGGPFVITPVVPGASEAHPAP